MSFRRSGMSCFLAISLVLAIPLINNCDDDNVSSPPSSNDPDCEIVPSTVEFGAVTCGHFSDMTFTMKNIGGGIVAGDINESCDHYSIIAGDGPYSLGAGDSLVVTVRFEPTSPGTRTCTIETGNALCSGVPCTGEATYADPEIPDTVRVQSLDIPLGTTEFDLRVYMYNDEELIGITIPIAWSSPDLTCESIDFGGSRVDYIATRIAEIDNPNQRVVLGVMVFFEAFISPGSGLVCTIRFSVDPSATRQVVIADKTFYPPASPLELMLPSGFGFVPQFVSGTVNLGDPPPGTSALERSE